MPKPQISTLSKGDPEAARFDVANRAFFRLYQSSNLMHKVGARFVSEFGSTTQQWAVLGALVRPKVKAQGMTVKDLIEFLLLSRQNLTSVLDRLEERNWVERVKDPEDGRNRRINLTPVGEEVWSRMIVSIGNFYEQALHDFSPEDKMTLYKLLDRLKSNFGAL